MTASTPLARVHTPRLAFPALILGNVILAMGAILVRLSDVGPVAAAFWRVTLAAPVLAMLAGSRLTGTRLSAGHWTAILFAGLFFAADLASWHLGILYTKVANATLFGNASALMLPLWALVVLRQRIGWVQAVALALATVGGGILMGSSYELAPANLRGDMLSLLAGVLYTAYLLVVQDARQRMDSWSVLALTSVIAAPPLLAAALAMGEQVMPGDWLPVIAIALCSQVIGQGLLTYAIGWFSPLVLGLSLLVQPAVSALAGWLLFDEAMTATDGIGALLVAVALILVRMPARA
ncbi:DMT family transporter [Sphingobium ummariense]|nr:DMT family transporter [Sphingobium ummariense]